MAAYAAALWTKGQRAEGKGQKAALKRVVACQHCLDTFCLVSSLYSGPVLPTDNDERRADTVFCKPFWITHSFI